MVNDGLKYLVGGWPTPLKNMSSSSWDDDIQNIIYGKIKFMFQSTNQIIV